MSKIRRGIQNKTKQNSSKVSIPEFQKKKFAIKSCCPFAFAQRSKIFRVSSCSQIYFIRVDFPDPGLPETV
jgi:hypothetical protein